jgi:hypothetical protein
MTFLRSLLLALLFSLLLGLVIGTWLRLRMERPVRYFVTTDAVPDRSGVAASPLDLGDAAAVIVEAREHEEQIRKSIEIA